ncbi:MAG: lipopolysaccharide heptosyltransferase II [Acidobacteria bacterium]|nr:lipopolysaccharide heptosyltransferase II [Acidobacteriota bacterium]
MKILIRGTNWIGDAVMSIPAMRELRRVFPDAHISLHTRSWAEGIFRDADFIDEIIAFDKESGLNGIVSETKRIGHRHFDLGIIFPNSYRSAALAKIANIKRRFGYAKEGRRFLLTDPVTIPEWKNSRHEVFYYLNLVAEAEQKILGTNSVESCEPDISLNISEERRNNARLLLEKAGCDLSKPLVGFGPGSTNSMAKRWPAENFASLAGLLKAKHDANIILMGSSSEKGVAENVSQLAKAQVVDLAGSTTLADATALLAEMDIFISNDMGLAHLAAAAGTPVYVLFGPTNPITTRPFAENATVIRETVECSPCMLRECPIDHRCMTRMTPQWVFDMVIDRLREKGR